MKACVFGGQYGSEGKGSFAEYLLNRAFKRISCPDLVVFGENSPNSVHTNSAGKTRNIPVSSFYASNVILGPDSVIDIICLVEDIKAVNAFRADHNIKPVTVYIHQNAALLRDNHIAEEEQVVKSISSTGSGSGAARYHKQFDRTFHATIGQHYPKHIDLCTYLYDGITVNIVSTEMYFKLLKKFRDCDWIFECSQGTLLDVNFGRYPYVTSRTTLPRAAIERNGLGAFDWSYYGVYRTYPIRTGGPSGPTGGKETTFKAIGVPDEIATVTKRVRRVFEFCPEDFRRSLTLTRPNVIAFTHMDYINNQDLMVWLNDNYGVRHVEIEQTFGVKKIFYSNELGMFLRYE